MENKEVVEESSDSGRFSPSSAGDSNLPVDLFDDAAHTVDSINEVGDEDSMAGSIAEEPEKSPKHVKPSKSGKLKKSDKASSSKVSANDIEKDTKQKAEEEKCYKRIMHLLNSSKFFTSFLLKKLEQSGLNQDKKNQIKTESASDKSESPSTTKQVLTESASNEKNVRGKRPLDDEDKDNPTKKSKKRKKINVDISDVLTKEEVEEAHRQHMEKEILESEDKENEVGNSSPVKTKVTSLGLTVPASQPNLLIGGALRDYQLKGLEWLKVLFENGVSGILADEMGLGKTIQVISLLCHLIEMGIRGPYLVVAPLSTLSNWLHEFEKFAPEIPVVLFYGSAEERKAQRRKLKTATKINDKLTAVLPVVVTSYQVPLQEKETLCSINWQYIVVDEGHSIKNKDTQLNRVLTACTSQNRLLLTGTPLQNNLIELWTLLNFLMPDMFHDITIFHSLLDLSDAGKDAQKILQKEKEQHVVSTLHQILFPFVLRRLKSDIAIDIPPKKEVVVYCPMTEVQRELYEYILKKNIRNKIPHFELGNLPAKRAVGTSYKDYFSDHNPDLECEENLASSDDHNLDLQCEENLASAEMPTRSSILRKESIKNKRNDFFDLSELPKCKELYERMACEFKERVKMQSPQQALMHIVNHPYLVMMPFTRQKHNRFLLVNDELIKTSGKFLVLEALLAKLKQRGHKVLLFSTSCMLLDMAEDLMVMRNHSYVRLDGNSKLMARKDDIFAFNTNPDMFAFLISTRAGGLGINLTGADTVILLNSDWNPMADLQAQDRAHRIGQTKPVVVYRFTVSNTVDEKIIKIANNKKTMEKVVMKSDVFKLNHVPQLDLLELAMLLKEKNEKEFVHSNSCGFTEEELEQLLDRSDMMGAETSKSNSSNSHNK
ncbi:lymphocyte-specific helicase-like [Nilaparvata lugens]|uniref:lymphocyte-specific helicase-like n=1 Tax=Nilaparvata lugens TaxID=108931 RepID=UPI00193D914A|nr:lymphocyte-specific helicase-like [Nilaparvata lugens]